MMKKSIFAALLAGMISTQSCVWASAPYNVSYDIETQKVTVKGTAAKAYADVTLEILRAGKNVADLDNLAEANAHNVIFQYDQCIADENGDFVFEFELADAISSGDYVTCVTWDGEAKENKLSYISPADFDNSILAVNTATNETQMLSAIESGIEFLGIQNPYYNKLSPEEKTVIAKAVLDERGETGYTYDFADTFNKAMAVEAMNHSGADDVEALEVLEYYEDVFKISGLKSYPTFIEQTDETKKAIADILESGSYETAEDVKAAFEDATVRCALYYASGYDKVYAILSSNNHILNINFTAYNALSSKSTVDKKMMEKLFASASEITNAFNLYVSGASNIYVPGGSSGSGGGGGNGGSSGSSVSMPVISNQNVNINKEETKAEFNDIESVAWAKASIERLAEEKIVSGKGNNEFAPLDEVKREEFVTMLVLALNIHSKDAKCDFNDVGASDWFGSYVASGVNAGLVSGISATAFGAGENISKQDIATLLYRAAELKGKSFESTSDLSAFSDSEEISEYAKKAAAALYSEKIINGNGSGKFEPKKSATRAETAVMLDRFLQWL